MTLFGARGGAMTAVRERVSPWRHVGESAAGSWLARRRWIRAIREERLFTCVRPAPACFTARQMAERAAMTLGALAPDLTDARRTRVWLPPSKQALVDELTDALGERESVLRCCSRASPGLGKTCVLRALRHGLPGHGFRLTYCHNARLGRRDFHRQLCLALGLSSSATAVAVVCEVSTHIEELGRERVHPVFLLDEPHLLHQDTLDHLHILLMSWFGVNVTALPPRIGRGKESCHGEEEP